MRSKTIFTNKGNTTLDIYSSKKSKRHKTWRMLVRCGGHSDLGSRQHEELAPLSISYSDTEGRKL